MIPSVAHITDATHMQQLVLASQNTGKLQEFAALFAHMPDLTVVRQSSLGVSEIDEPFGTFVENALVKARHASRITGLPALADDSGLCVPALHGAPGVLSARFAGEPRDDHRNNAKLLEAMKVHDYRSAYYYCVLVLVRHADDPQPMIADGRWWGQIAHAERGTGGFGYDPLFWLPEYQCTAAELESERKNRLSHRATAMARLLQQVESER